MLYTTSTSDLTFLFLHTSILYIKGSKKSLGNNRWKLCNQKLYGIDVAYEYKISCWIFQFGEERAKLPLWISGPVEVVVQPLCHMFTSIIDCVGQKVQTARSRTLSIWTFSPNHYKLWETKTIIYHGKSRLISVQILRHLLCFYMHIKI